MLDENGQETLPSAVITRSLNRFGRELSVAIPSAHVQHTSLIHLGLAAVMLGATQQNPAVTELMRMMLTVSIIALRMRDPAVASALRKAYRKYYSDDFEGAGNDHI